MLNLLNSIVQTAIALVKFVVHSINSLVLFVTKIPQFITILSSSIAFMPTLIMPFALVTISISVVLFVVNRR